MAPELRVHRWVPRLLALVALALVPWTLWLTFSLPSRHVTQHYDAAWVGFDIALAAAFAATAWSALRRPRWLVALAAATGTMLLCDAWFDVVTSSGGAERVEAVAEAAFAEIPLAAICAYIVLEAERFEDWMRKFRPPRGSGAPGSEAEVTSDAAR
jgi:predicted branched-subunit amino acid permease